MLIRFLDKTLFSWDFGPHCMRTLSEHIDDLDRMVDGGAAKAEIRSQIAFIGREVAALEAENAQLIEAHAQLQEAHTKLQEAHTKLQEAQVDNSPRFSGSGGTVGHVGG
jgi:exonuclease VII small subunit